MAEYMLCVDEMTVQQKLKAVTNDIAVLGNATEVFQHGSCPDLENGLRQGLLDAHGKLRDILREMGAHDKQ